MSPRAPSRFAVGDPVQTPLGKGVVRDARNNHRLVVDVSGRAIVFAETSVSLLETAKRAGRLRPEAPRQPAQEPIGSARRAASAEVDLHGLTVEEALSRAEQAINDAILADLPQLRLIHGKGGGRIRAALHRRLQGMPSVRRVRLDPSNPGVTIVGF